MTPPFVSAIVAAHDYGRYLPACLDSALAQDYPADRLEIVVVDDGSTDDTPEVLARYAAAHPDRITVVRQDNAGFIAATDRALGLARGELIAILDADDTWHPHKTRAQVELFRSNPRLGLACGDMSLVDERGAPLAPSWFAMHDSRPQRGRALGTLIGRNYVMATTVMVRADLRDVFAPLPPEREVPCQDWWIAARVAAVADVDFLPEPCAAYRRHGTNMSGAQVSGAGETVNLTRHIRMVRSLLARTDEQQVRAADLAHAVGVELEGAAAVVQRIAGTPYARLADVTEADREAAERELAAGGRPVERLFAAARAIGHDPFCEPARARLRTLLERFGGDAATTIAAAARAHGGRPALVLAEADELLATPALCDAIAALGADDPVTVAIAIDDARFAEIVPALEALLARRGLDGDGDGGADLLAFPCPPTVVQQLPEGLVAGIVTATPRRGAHPCFGAADGAALRDLVARPAVAAA